MRTVIQELNSMGRTGLFITFRDLECFIVSDLTVEGSRGLEVVTTSSILA